MKARLEGKVAIVTGGAAGIGAATCRRLAEEGAAVVVADLDADGAADLAGRIGADASAVAFDAGDPDSIGRLVAVTIERHGRLDVLHNNAALTSAAVTSRDTTVIDMDLDLWDRVMTVNLRGYMVAAKHAIPAMVAGGGGSIVMTSSGSALAGDDRSVAYSVSKAGVLALTRHIATAHGKQGVRCNAICPGMILVERNAQMPDDRRAVMEANTLVPRLGRPEDIAAMVAYLASDDAAFVTGQAISVDGGLGAHQPYLAEFRAAGLSHAR